MFILVIVSPSPKRYDIGSGPKKAIDCKGSKAAFIVEAAANSPKEDGKIL